MPIFYPQVTHSLAGNTSGTLASIGTGTYVLAGGNNITLSQNANTVTISAGAGGGAVVSNAIQQVSSATGSGTNTSRFAADDHVHAGVYHCGVSNDAGNTSGDTKVSVGRFIFRGGNNITLSQITAANELNTIVVSGGAGGAGNTISEWCPYPELNVLSASSLVQNSIYFNPVDVKENLNAYRVNFFISVSTQISASNNTKSGGYTLSMCLYTRGSDASTERLMSLLSRSAFISFTASSHTRIQIGHPAGIANSTSVSQSSTSGAATNTSTYVVSSVGGYRVLPFPISSTLTPGRYWMAVANSSTSANAQGLINCGVVQQTHGSNIAYMPFATASKASNASWPQVFPGRGVYSATSAAFPATVALSTDHIRQLATTVVMPFWNVSGYTTVTNMP